MLAGKMRTKIISFLLYRTYALNPKSSPRTANILARGIKFNTSFDSGYHIAFGQNIARGFYSYLLVKNGHGTIATVYGRKTAYRSEEFLQNTINYFSDFLDGKELYAGKKFGGYGHFENRKNYYDENGAMYIGEVGGFQDYFWEFGMKYSKRNRLIFEMMGYLASPISYIISFSKYPSKLLNVWYR